MKKLDFIILVIILIVAFSARWYKIGDPLADLHSWRQVDTAAVARNFANDGFDLLHPKFDDLTSRETGIENPNGYRMVEFPLYNAIFGALYRYLPITTLEVYGRATTAVFSLMIIAVIYYLTLKESSRLAAIAAASVYAIFPFFVYMSRMILPETPALAFAFLAIFFLYKWDIEGNRNKKYIYFGSSIISFALGILVKPTVIFYALALGFIFLRHYRFSVVKNWRVYLFFILTIIPFALWRIHISKYPEGIPANSWLFTQVNTFEGVKTIFFRPAFFRWIFFDRIGVMMFGVYLSFFFLLGVVGKTTKYLLHFILLSAIVYLFTFQGGNVQHEYYQTILLPPLAIFIGLGISYIYTNRKEFIHPILSTPIVIATLVLAFAFSYYKVKDFYNYPQDLVRIASMIQSLTKEDDKIVTDRLGDTTLLYLANRKGSPQIDKNPEEFKNMGYSHIVTANKDRIKELDEQGYSQVFENEYFSIFKL